jgi:hypothetical protein
MDGAIANTTPILTAAKLGASRIVVLSTGIACSLQEPPKGAIARALHGVTLLIERLGDDIHVCLVPTLTRSMCRPMISRRGAISWSERRRGRVSGWTEAVSSAGFSRMNSRHTAITTTIDGITVLHSDGNRIRHGFSRLFFRLCNDIAPALSNVSE